MSRGRLIFAVFYFTVVLIGTIHLRNSSSRLFSRYREAKLEQGRLIQELRKKQLLLEGMMTPGSISDILEKTEAVPPKTPRR